MGVGIKRFKTSVDVEPLEINEEDYTEGAEEKQAMDENPEGLYGDVEVDEQ
uniref:Uncharacterized protein n=1 Tax=Oryza brachyantha TaxID=4533 RepID=J3MEF5_ORYBR